MQIKTIVSGNLYNNTYIVIKNNKAILIDASPDLSTIKKYLGALELQAVLITHGHFDHIYNLKQILEYYNCKCYLKKQAFDKLKDVKLNCSCYAIPFICDISQEQCVFVEDGDIIDLIDCKIKVVATPGHTDCGLCYVIDNNIFVGDTLFFDGYGRVDLPTSNANDMKKSLTKLKTIYKNYRFYSGHGQNGII